MPRIRDLFSLEFVFTFFYLIAAYKGSPLLESVRADIDLTVMTVCLGLACGLPRFLRRHELSADGLRYLGFYFIFLAYASISYVLTRSSEEAVLKIQRQLVFSTWCVVAPLLLINTVERVQRFLRLAVPLSVVLVTQGMMTVLSGTAGIAGIMGTDSYQAVGRYGGAALVATLALVLAGVGVVRQSVLLMVSATLFGAVLLSASRQATLGTVVAALFLVALRRNSEGFGRLAKRVVMALGTIAVISVAWRFYAAEEYDFGRLASRMEVFSEGTSHLAEDARWAEVGRFAIYSTSIDMWLNHPMYGAGFGSFATVGGMHYRHSHNMILELLCELGITGLLAYALVLGWPARALWRQSRRSMDGTSLVLGGVWMFFVTCAMFSGDLPDNRHILTFSGLILAHEMARRVALTQPLAPKPVVVEGFSSRPPAARAVRSPNRVSPS